MQDGECAGAAACVHGAWYATCWMSLHMANSIHQELFARYISAHRVENLHSLGCARVWTKAEGAYLWDDSGGRYIDFCAGFALFSLGRNNPAVRAALHELLDSGLPNLIQMDCPPLAAELAELLVKLAPPSLERVVFCNSGAESVEAAVKLARKATQRTRFLFCDGAFHGLTTGALSLNGDHPLFRERFGDLLPSTRIPFNDLEALERELQRGDVAGFVVEPIQGKSMQVAGDDYLCTASRLCKQHGALLIVDEVQTGIGRTGKMFACEYSGVQPDILTVSKALSGGFIPIGACLHSQEVHDKVFPPGEFFVHSTTFKENNMAMVAALTTLRQLSAGNYLKRVLELSSYFVEAVAPVRARHERLGAIRGRGLMLGMDIDAHPDMVVRHVTSGLFREEQIIVQPAPWIKLTPPFVITEADIDRFAEALDQVMARLPAREQ